MRQKRKNGEFVVKAKMLKRKEKSGRRRGDEGCREKGREDHLGDNERREEGGEDETKDEKKGNEDGMEDARKQKNK